MCEPFVFTTQSEATSIENSISCGFIGVVVGKSLTKVFSKKSFYQQIFFSRCASANRESHLTREHKLKCWALSIEAGSAMWKWMNVAQRWGRRKTFKTLMLSASSAVVGHKFNRKNKAIAKTMLLRNANTSWNRWCDLIFILLSFYEKKPQKVKAIFLFIFLFRKQ